MVFRAGQYPDAPMILAGLSAGSNLAVRFLGYLEALEVSPSVPVLACARKLSFGEAGVGGERGGLPGGAGGGFRGGHACMQWRDAVCG